MTRVFKDDEYSDVGLVVDSKMIRLNGSKDNHILVDGRGTTISGPISFAAGGQQMRFAALWTMNSEIALSIPSTLATPTAVMVIDPPGKQLASLIEEATVIMKLTGMLA